MAKRIIFTVTNDLSYDQRMNRIAATLTDHGYEVMLVGRELENSRELESKPYKRIRLKCNYNKGKLFYLEYNIRLFFFLRKQAFDAIGTVDHDTLLAGWLAARIRKKPVIHDAHELFTEVPELQGRRLSQAVWKRLERWVFPRLDAIYTVGSAIADHYKKEYHRNVEVVRNMPSPRHLSAPYQHARPYLLYQGALNEGRGLETFISAMRQLEGLDLLLIGEGDLSRQLRSQVQSLGLENKVHFLGFLPPEQMWPYTCGAWLGLNVSENKGLSYYLSLNNKFFDYVQAGLPQLLNDFPEYRQLNAEFQVGYLVSCSEPEIIQAIQKLQKDVDLYTTLKDNCRLAAKTWTWEQETGVLLGVYRKLLG